MRAYPYLPFRICGDMSYQDRIDVLQDIGVHGKDLAPVQHVSKTILSRLPRRFNRSQLAAECLRAVQHLEYRQHLDDRTGADLFQRVDYTVDHGGNCEDLGSVLVAVCMHFGLLAMVVWIPQRDRPLNHVAVQIRLGDEWVWADPTIADARLGETAYQVLDRSTLALHPADLVFRPARSYRSLP